MSTIWSMRRWKSVNFSFVGSNEQLGEFPVAIWERSSFWGPFQVLCDDVKSLRCDWWTVDSGERPWHQPYWSKGIKQVSCILLIRSKSESWTCSEPWIIEQGSCQLSIVASHNQLPRGLGLPFLVIKHNAIANKGVRAIRKWTKICIHGELGRCTSKHKSIIFHGDLW